VEEVQDWRIVEVSIAVDCVFVVVVDCFVERVVGNTVDIVVVESIMGFAVEVPVDTVGNHRMLFVGYIILLIVRRDDCFPV